MIVGSGTAQSCSVLLSERFCCHETSDLMMFTEEIYKYQGVKNFTMVARMQNSSSILRPTDDKSSMF